MNPPPHGKLWVKTYLEVLESGVLGDPVRVQDAQSLQPTANLDTSFYY